MSEADLSKTFRAAVNTHGYGFQYAVLEHIRSIINRERWSTVFEASELPVMAGPHDTKVDFVLRTSNAGVFILGECKRANPSLSHWIFARTKYETTSRAPRVRFERIFSPHPYGSSALRRGIQEQTATDGGPYHVGIVVKTNKKGENSAPQRNAIDDGLTQLGRAIAGFGSLLGQQPRLFRDHGALETVLIPALFTTARLFVCDELLESADLSSGNLPERATFSEVDRLWCQHAVSVSAQNQNIELEQPSNRLGGYHEAVYLRSFAVVTPQGIEDFLGSV